VSLRTFSGIILIFVVLSGCGGSDKHLVTAQGEQENLQEFHGQWLLINYWAIWCKPCIEEIPELNHIHTQEDIVVRGYNFDRKTGEALRSEADKLNIEFPLLGKDPAATFAQEAPRALPATMVISPDGAFQRWLMGPQTEKTVRSALAELTSR